MRTIPIKSCTAYLQLLKRFCCYSQPPVASCEESGQRIDRLDRLVSSDIELTAHPPPERSASFDTRLLTPKRNVVLKRLSPLLAHATRVAYH